MFISGAPFAIHEIAEADGGQRDETEVERLQERPRGLHSAEKDGAQEQVAKHDAQADFERNVRLSFFGDNVFEEEDSQSLESPRHDGAQHAQTDQRQRYAYHGVNDGH